MYTDKSGTSCRGRVGVQVKVYKTAAMRGAILCWNPQLIRPTPASEVEAYISQLYLLMTKNIFVFKLHSFLTGSR